MRVTGGGADPSPWCLTPSAVCEKKRKEPELPRSGRRNVPVWRPGGCFQAETGALGAVGVRPEAETEEPASRQLVPAMACSSRTPDGKTNG